MGLTLLLGLQELHVIIVKHQAATDDAAGSYAVAAVAGKAIMWIAIGLGLYLLPEASRRAKRGEDARPILLRTLGLIAAMAVPAVLIYSVAGEPLLRIVFGKDLTQASDALPFLGLGDVAARLLVPVGAVPARDGQGELPARARGRDRRRGAACCSSIGDDLTAIAIALLGIQAVCAATILTMAMRQKRPTGVVFSRSNRRRAGAGGRGSPRTVAAARRHALGSGPAGARRWSARRRCPRAGPPPG